MYLARIIASLISWALLDNMGSASVKYSFVFSAVFVVRVWIAITAVFNWQL